MAQFFDFGAENSLEIPVEHAVGVSVVNSCESQRSLRFALFSDTGTDLQPDED
jgi:hypothetical protein